jgi:hypothetical protein
VSTRQLVDPASRVAVAGCGGAERAERLVCSAQPDQLTVCALTGGADVEIRPERRRQPGAQIVCSGMEAARRGLQVALAPARRLQAALRVGTGLQQVGQRLLRRRQLLPGRLRQSVVVVKPGDGGR